MASSESSGSVGGIGARGARPYVDRRRACRRARPSMLLIGALCAALALAVPGVARAVAAESGTTTAAAESGTPTAAAESGTSAAPAIPAVARLAAPAAAALRAAQQQGNGNGAAEDESSGGPPAAAQQVLRVFLECTECDREYLSAQVSFVNFVSDRETAQVNVAVTGRDSGSGTQYEVAFSGRGDLAGVDDVHEFFEPSTSTARARNSSLAQVLRIGLLEYLLGTPAIGQFEIDQPGRQRRDTTVAATPEDDPWNFWVYRISANIRGGGESQRSNRNLFGSFSANRTTQEWKLRLSTNFRYNDRTVELSDGEFVNVTRGYGVTAEVVRSMGDHWGSALRFEASHSTFNNQDLTMTLAPGIEYNIYPYSESTRRQLTFRYEIGSSQFNYQEKTLFGETAEFLVDGTLRVNYDVNQPWGNSGLSVELANYMHDFSKYRAELFGNLDFRITRGLSIDLNGSGSFIRDQLFLPAGDLSDEEVLLRRRALETTYRYEFSVGFTYTFGSIFNTAVNPRFAGRRGGFERNF